MVMRSKDASTSPEYCFRSTPAALSMTLYERPAANAIFTKTPRLLAGRFEALVDSFRVFGSDRNFLILLAEFLVNEGDGVVARRQALDLILSVFVGDGKEWALHHVDIHLHPGMLVALDREHDFFTGEILLDVRGGGWLRLVPLAVIFRCGMNVVRGGICVLDIYGLASHHAKHVRMIAAALLLKDYW